MERNLNKVYINPNFNQRPLVNPVYVPYNSNVYASHMHVNPNFSQMQLQNNYQPNITAKVTKRRIFVNPNFVAPNYYGNNGYTGMSFQSGPQPLEAAVNSTCHPNIHVELSNTKMIETAKPTVQPAITKSRYTLVRSKTELPSNSTIQPKIHSSTVKINKYKTARLSLIKNNFQKIDTPKAVTKVSTFSTCIERLSHKDTPRTSSRLSYGSRKYIKVNKTGHPVRKVSEFKPTISKKLLLVKRNSFNSIVQTNQKVISDKFKKNNIPCPLFSKYGKCLRKIRGTCEFLHDKKHVSLCRKFLKGICHDGSCRFSHELSAKKMPTCYFYLNAMCMKENCPYLHVKLNNDAKVCNDFLKGYCEKGDKCINRHVNKKIQSVIKHSIDVQRHYSNSSSPIVLPKTIIKVRRNVSRKDETKGKNSLKNELSTNEKSQTECRYFKETGTTEEDIEACDVIKPSRCKLGSLPSFIKL